MALYRCLLPRLRFNACIGHQCRWVMDDVQQEACQAVEGQAEGLRRLSQDIWSHPEENFQEHHAHNVLTDFLHQAGFRVERSYKLPTAFRAEFENGAGPNIGVLCEYDALPVIGHACGHNLIAEVGVAAAIGVKAAMEKVGNIKGKVTVLGTPAEEGGGGKIDLIRAGAFKDVDVAMMAHPAPHTFSRANCLSYVGLTVKYHGKASHAAGFPWEGLNALDAAVTCYSTVSCLRQQMKPTWRVHGVIKNGGEKPNIIPALTELEYYLRAPSDKELAQLQEKITACVESAATATGCRVEYTYLDKGYSTVINNDAMVSLYEKHALALGVKFSEDAEAFAHFTGSTDMGNVTHELPGIHPMFYIGSRAVNHTPDFTTAAGSEVAQPYTLTQGKALALTALDLLRDPSQLEKVKADFLADKAKRM